MAGSLAIAWGRATSVEFDPDVLDMFVASGSSEAPELRAPTISGLSSGVRESEADLGSRHICLFFGRHEERWEAFRPFFLKHFYAGKPTVYIHSASSREEIMDRVHDEGLDPNEVSRRGLLTLIPARDAYLKNPTFTPEFMVAFMRLQIIRKRADNHPSHLLTVKWIGSSRMRRVSSRCTTMRRLSTICSSSTRRRHSCASTISPNSVGSMS